MILIALARDYRIILGRVTTTSQNTKHNKCEDGHADNYGNYGNTDNNKHNSSGVSTITQN